MEIGPEEEDIEDLTNGFLLSKGNVNGPRRGHGNIRLRRCPNPGGVVDYLCPEATELACGGRADRIRGARGKNIKPELRERRAIDLGKFHFQHELPFVGEGKTDGVDHLRGVNSRHLRSEEHTSE